MSNDMKTIMESWKKGIKEYTPDHEKRKEDFLAPLKQKAQDKASRHLARTVAGERPSGRVYPGTDQGEQDVRARQDWDQWRDVESFMKLRGIKNPEDLPKEGLLTLLELVTMYLLLRKGPALVQSLTRSAAKRFPYYKTQIQNIGRKIIRQAPKINLSYKHPVMKSLRKKLAKVTAGDALGKAAHLFMDDLLVWMLGGLAGALMEETKK
tara:strand:+ start:406 stop:1032 length:627 start_codon:yes stop_codon:yes gene_type:complete